MSKCVLDSLISSGDSFDVEKHASKILQSSVADVSKHVSELTEAEHELERQLEDHVSSHYQDLLSQATGVERLETHLSTVSSQAQALSAAVERTRTRVLEPYESIRTQTITLARLQETCDLLRRIIRILQLGKKLRGQLQAGPSEIAKAAQSLSELSELWQPEDELSGIDIIEQDQRILMHARADVEKSADVMLANGMETKNQNQMALALQVYFNLGVLQAKIDDIVVKKVNDVRSKVVELIDVQRIVAVANESSSSSATAAAMSSSSAGSMPGRPSRTAPTSTLNVSGFRSVLWSNMETVFDVLFSAVCETMQLQKILCKKRDLLGNSFFELLDSAKRQVVESVWKQVMDVFKRTLDKATSGSSLMKETLEGEFPKMIRLYNDLWYRLCQSALTYLIADPTTSSANQLVNPFQSDAATYQQIRESVLTSYERAYLSKSLSRLFDPINLMFSSSSRDKSSTFDQDELKRIFRVVGSELSIAQVDQGLLVAVSKNIAKTVQLICNKSEQILVTETENVGYPGEDQKSNINTVNCLYAFDSGIRSCVQDSALQDHPQAKANVLNALGRVDTLIRTAINPLCRSIRDGVDAILSTLHNEDFASSDTSGKKSSYMKELQTFTSRVCVEFLTNFDCKATLAEAAHDLASSCVDLFVLHASLVRPLSAGGRSRLAFDCVTLEPALEPLFAIGQFKNDEASLQRVRAFKVLLAADAKSYASCPVVTERQLPVSVCLHLLFSFGPPELKSPHESAGWTISRYMTWLEDHPSESDRLQLIQGALEHYVASTRARREKSYAFPYPIMLELLQSAFKQ